MTLAERATQILYTDRSRSQSYLRCKRQRWHEYESGPTGKGIVPKRKSIHLVIGLAFHDGAKVLLRRAMQADGDYMLDAENNAVQAALAELHVWAAAGIELDVVEQPEPGGKDALPADTADGISSGVVTGATAESPIIIEFEDFQVTPPATQTIDDFSPTYPQSHHELSEEDKLLESVDLSIQANFAQATGVDDYLKKELAALVEAMVRGYARRRLKPLLEEFEVLEVEREGTWKLGEFHSHAGLVGHPADGSECDEYCGGFDLHWMSRHDGLLLERSTNQLYLLSFKTTGSWDRRKKQDAEIDMQGLSEAVDVEKRLGEAWEIVHKTFITAKELYRVAELCSERIAKWLETLPAPPRILAVRYEYILKGQRRQDKKDPISPGRYVQDTPFLRAYLSSGLTSEDDRWAPKYEWHSSDGKQRRVDYRSWKKQATWERMTTAAWIDRLDQGDYWPGKGDDFDDRGNPVDVLADQFVPPVVVYRNEDDMRDWLEQIEAQEVKVALDAAEVKQAKDEGETRSALNRLFPQTRTACCWPGPCSFMKICYGGEDIRRDPLAHSDLYQPREANHPIEMTSGGE